MSFVNCECGCTLFETIVPMQFDQSDFRVWSYASRLKPEVATIPVVKCVRCDRITIPPTSMMGKNTTDPEVKAYAQLIEDVKVHNSRVKSFEDLIVKTIFSQTFEDRIARLESDFNPVVVNNLSEEVTEVVKTTKRGRKSTKASV